MYFKINFRIFVYLLFFLLLASLAAADDLQFNLQKENYKSFETVQIDLFLNNITLTRDLDISNLVLLNPDNSSVSIAKTKIKIDENHYFFYFDLPSLDTGNYGVLIKDVNYLKNGNLQINSFSKILTIIPGMADIISVRPAYVIKTVSGIQEVKFTLSIFNKGNNSVNIGLTKEGDFFSFKNPQFNLFPGTSKNIDIQTSLFGKNQSSFNGTINVNYGAEKYDIVFIVAKTDYLTQQNIGETENNTGSFNASIIHASGSIYLTTLSNKPLDNLTIELDIGDYYPSGQIVINNNADISLNNISYFISGEINGFFELQPENIDFLESNNSAVFLLGINNSADLVSGEYDGFLNVNSSEGLSVSIPIKLLITGDAPINYTSNFSNSEVFNTTPSFNQTADEPDKKKDSNVWLFFVFIIFIFLIVIYFIYKKTKAKKEKFESFVDEVKKRREY